MVKQMKRTSGANIQRRQGLDHKFQDLITRICIGGRTDIKIQESLGALKRKRIDLAVDLRSNGCGCGCGGPRREPGARVHVGPHRRGTPRFNQNRPRAIARPWT
jgi:hypothetical protein